MNRRDVLRSLLAGGIATSVTLRAPAAGAHRHRLKPGPHSALIIVDVQNCFLNGGTLAVEDGDAVVPVINRIAPAFVNVILTQDWHPPHHVSFASAHPGAKPYETIRLSYGRQVLWPDHCVQGTPDAQLDARLKVSQASLILRKGFHAGIDSYSAFEEADRKTPTGLGGYLKQRDIRQLIITGLATDFCVAWTALDARRAGFETYVVEDACRGIDIDGSLAAAWHDMRRQGVIRITSTDLDLG